MEKTTLLRSIYRAACFRSSRFTTVASAASAANYNHHLPFRNFLSISSPSASDPPTFVPSGWRSSYAIRSGSMRYFSDDVSRMPPIKDADILNAFKDLMAASWDELPYSVVPDAKKALSKGTDDKAGQEALKNVLCAAEAVEEFGGVIISMKMELDDSVGMSGENVKPLSDDFAGALKTVFQKYTTYLDAFGPHETYLKKKVETELGSKMIYLKMRCGHLGAEWGKNCTKTKSASVNTQSPASCTTAAPEGTPQAPAAPAPCPTSAPAADPMKKQTIRRPKKLTNPGIGIYVNENTGQQSFYYGMRSRQILTNSFGPSGPPTVQTRGNRKRKNIGDEVGTQESAAPTNKK